MSNTRKTQKLIPLLCREYLGFDGSLGRIFLYNPDAFPVWKSIGFIEEDEDEDGPGGKPLEGRTLERDIDQIRILIDQNKYALEETDRYGRSPLHFMCSLHSPGQLAVIRLMLSKSANVKMRDSKLRTPLHHLLSPYNLPLYQQSDDDLDESPRVGLLDLVSLLLDSGANVNAQDYELVTPLHLASKNGHFPYLVQTLIDRGADCTAADADGTTPLHFVCSLFSSRESGLDSHHIYEVIQVLIKNGADVNAIDLQMRTPFFILIKSHRPFKSVVDFLLRAGADPNLANVGGTEWNTPLHLVCRDSRIELAESLLCFGADVNEVDYAGNTALHEVAISDEQDPFLTCVQMLIDAGADLAAENYHGCTPLLVLRQFSPYKLIIAHVALRVAAGKYALSQIEREFLDTNDTFAKFYADCSNCVPAMKAQSLGNSSVTLWHFLLAPQRQARQYTRNPLILEDLRISKTSPEFVPFSQIINERILDCEYFHRLYELAFRFVKALFSNNLPVIVFEKIISNLNDFDLTALASAVHWR